MNTRDIAALRREYAREELTRRSVQDDPLEQFSMWFDEAMGAQVLEPSAMTLATASADGHPSARIVLLKGLVAEGLVFYTNYDSAKAHDLAANPRASLLFFWPELERQVRIAGVVSKVSAVESDAYFQSRPFESRVGAIASAQSSVLTSRDELEERYQRLLQEYEGKDVPRPDTWGGYVLKPHTWEFWQGRPSRLHDRIRYRKDGDFWHVDRLSP